ncbi:DNA-binding transcriptional MerR regulator [Paenibacillus anaericanus]|uniref:MerR family transcriptional regulator n=1 Tax=Paenibacillus anaericanus TaxID=170367 RepID=A0A3S1BRU8_9BACL|nr:MerR family transcriptional regulator [Paenibacillus anaericanus]MDQ0087876.1 DNA-binding transcriptional MerR regulator [Paenibacillus anaericanus]RUT48209.1 MerR family transcriptional regulator [Paenibacillus anaericanus]
MLKIGDFSTLSKISIYMLRHYNEIGLLIPAHIDEFTGYRYYSEEQLSVANRIQALKSMGLGLSVIKDILSEYDDEKSLKRYLMLQASQKQEEIVSMQKQLLLLQTTIKSLEQNSPLSKFSIAIKELPRRNVISYRNTIATYEQEDILWEKLCSEIVAQNVQLGNPRYNIAIFRNEGIVEHGIDVEVQRVVVGTYQDTDTIRFKNVDPVIAATLTYKGGYIQLKEANQAIANWISDNGYEFNGPMFNILHVSPETEPDPENLITEVCFPIKSI